MDVPTNALDMKIAVFIPAPKNSKELALFAALHNFIGKENAIQLALLGKSSLKEDAFAFNLTIELAKNVSLSVTTTKSGQ